MASFTPPLMLSGLVEQGLPCLRLETGRASPDLRDRSRQHQRAVNQGREILPIRLSDLESRISVSRPLQDDGRTRAESFWPRRSRAGLRSIGSRWTFRSVKLPVFAMA